MLQSAALELKGSQGHQEQKKPAAMLQSVLQRTAMLQSANDATELRSRAHRFRPHLITSVPADSRKRPGAVLARQCLFWCSVMFWRFQLSLILGVGTRGFA